MNASLFVASSRITPLFIVFLLFGLNGCGGSSSPPNTDPDIDVPFNQVQNYSFTVGGPPPEFTTVNTIDVAALGGPFESLTIDLTKALGNISGPTLKPAPSAKTQIVTGVSHSNVTIAPASPAVGNCFPFGIGPLGNPPPTGSTIGWGPYGGFIYQNVPAFDLLAGGVLSFDLAQLNDVNIGLDIYMAPTIVNGGTAEAGVFTKVVSNSQVPANPRGDNIIGNFELRFIADNAFYFPGGGLIIRFSNPSAAYNADISCTQVLVNGDPSDTSGYFVERFLRDGNGMSTWDEVFPDTIGAFRIGGSAPLTFGATVEHYIGMGEEQDGLCGNAARYAQLITIYLNASGQLDSVQPGIYSAPQDIVDIYNTGSVATCTRVTPNVDVVASMSGLEADYETCTKTPGDFDGTWSGTFRCDGDPPQPITLTVAQNGGTATYFDGEANYSGFVCGNVFSFRGGNAAYDESGKLVIDDTNSDAAIKTSSYRSLTGPASYGSCTDTLTRQ
jgi:hypothetical protein